MNGMIRDLFSEKIKKEMSSDEWLILQEKYLPEENLKYESLFALSNGYLGIRGSHEEGTKITLPYVYINGVFDKSETFMRELATLPNWLGIRIYVEKELIGIENCEILEFARVLDMKRAVLVKHILLRDKKGRETLIEGLRFVSRNKVHQMGVKLYVTPINYSGIIEIENIVDGSVINFYDAPRFKVKHTDLITNKNLGENGIYMEVATRDNNLHIGTCSCIRAYKENEEVLQNRITHAFGEVGVEFADFMGQKGECVELIKYATMYTERDYLKESLYDSVKREVEDFIKTGFDKELKEHEKIYATMWQEANINIRGDFELDRAVRFNIFHLMSAANEHDHRVNVGAKLLSGEEYGGHAFWDTELFMLPFFSYIFPKTAKNLESYRYGLLDAARENAKKNGYNGAQYPWESADDGSEQCPDWTIEPDGSCYRCYVAVYEHHVTAAVAYGIYNYAKVTGDREFLFSQGAEILIETARFWVSRCEYTEAKDRYEIRQVTGPDEWHEPVNNNLYTNYLAKWNLRYVMALVDTIKEESPMEYGNLLAKTNLTKEETSVWQEVANKIYLPKKEGTKLLEQFEGYFELKDVTIENYDENDWPIRPSALNEMKTDKTQIIKQADVVMLLHLMEEEFDLETARINYNYYEKRTLHGSSLSPSIYSVMGLRVGDDSKAYRYLRRAAFLDILDLQKNTREGIHAANTGGVWQTVIFGFAGVKIDESGILHIKPNLPKEWDGLKFRLHYHKSRVEIDIDKNKGVKVKLLEGEHTKIKTMVGTIEI